jgi:hypothetical protein
MLGRAADLLKRARYEHLAGFTRDEYEMYELGYRSREEAETFISASQMWNVVAPALNDKRYQRLTLDKWVFARLADSAGLPVPRTLGLFHPQVGRTWRGGPLRTAGDLERLLSEGSLFGLVAKPVTGYQGRGVMIGDLVSDRRIRLIPDGEVMSFESLAAAMAPDGARADGGFILQERLEQHPLVAEINPDTFNPLRVQTLSKADGRVTVNWAGIVFGRQGDVVPSLAVGPARPRQARAGICVEVADLDAGTMGEGVIRPRHGGGRFREHPDSRVAFAGRRLPDWDAVIDLSKRGARAIPWMRSIGWDIGLTPKGAVIVEGNLTWNPMVVQAHGRGYLTPELRRELAAAGVEAPQAAPTLAQARRRAARKLQFALRRRLSL